MNKYREQIYAITNGSSESRILTTIFFRAYKHNLDKAYKILSTLSEQDKLKLLKYIDKKPFLSAGTIQKMTDVYCFFHITLKNNPEYYLRYKTNNFLLLEKPEDRLLLAKFATSLPVANINLGR